ncbi:MAG TPA: RecX family transcriptional regulator [Ignavibacteria bacterium]
MLITKIEKQKKRRGRYSIFLDNEFGFGITDNTLLKFGLRKNDELTEQKIDEIKNYDEFDYAKKYSFDLLSRSPKSEKEIRTKLKQKKISDSNIIKVIDALKELKFLDDVNYAKLFVESKLRNNPVGKAVIKNKLREKGISKELIEESIENFYDDAVEEKKAESILLKYMKKKTGDDYYTLKRKCFQHLVSKGFDFDLVNELLRKHLEKF